MSENTKRTMINKLGILGVISLLSYTAAVIFAPMAYPGYNWMTQAVSDLSAENAPSRLLWDQLSSLYGSCGIVSIMMVCVYVSYRKIWNKILRMGIYLFAAMNWVSAVGYKMFPLTESGYVNNLQNIMHVYVVTGLTVLLSIVSLVLIMIGGYKKNTCRSVAVFASVALFMMFAGAIGTGAAPKEYFGIFERFSVFAATAFNAVLGMYLFLGEKIMKI